MMNVCIPGVIVAYDGKLARVRPAMDMQLSSGEVLSPPEIVNVPMCWPIADGGRAQITVPMKAGDDVLLYFSQRSIENWLSGSSQAPDDPRQFDLTDCFASPVMRPGITADTENVNIQYGVGSIKLSPSGDLTIDVPNTTHNSPNITVNASNVEVNASQTTFNSDVTVNGLLTYTNGLVGEGGGGAKITGGVEIVGGTVTHNGTNIGDDHKHSGVVSGGSDTGGPI